MDTKFKNHKPVRYRIVHKCDDPRNIINALAREGIKAIIPIEAWELLDQPKKYLSARSLTCSTVSLPAHLNLKEDDIMRIGGIVKYHLIIAKIKTKIDKMTNPTKEIFDNGLYIFKELLDSNSIESIFKKIINKRVQLFIISN